MSVRTEFLVDWLEARIDDDKRDANRWHDIECDIHALSITDSAIAALVPGAVCDCHGPARLLAEVESKRAIIALHETRMASGPGYPEGWCAGCTEPRLYTHLVPMPCPTLRLLAAPYASEPGYRAEWAVSP